MQIIIGPASRVRDPASKEVDKKVDEELDEGARQNFGWVVKGS